MLKKLVSFVLTTVMVLSVPGALVFAAPLEPWDGTIATSFGGGIGTQSDPYQISDGRELAYIAQQTGAN
jgi:hypothetical protein